MTQNSSQPTGERGGINNGDYARSESLTKMIDQEVTLRSNASGKSAFISAQLNVLRQNVERRISERTALVDVKLFLRQLLGEMDTEIAMIRRMHELSVETTSSFMGEQRTNDKDGTMNGNEKNNNEDEPQPGCSKNLK